MPKEELIMDVKQNEEAPLMYLAQEVAAVQEGEHRK